LTLPPRERGRPRPLLCTTSPSGPAMRDRAPRICPARSEIPLLALGAVSKDAPDPGAALYAG